MASCFKSTAAVTVIVYCFIVPAIAEATFRCYRPLDALMGLQAATFSRQQNCDFEYIIIDSAAVNVECSSNNCVASLRFDARTGSVNASSVRDAYYKMELRAIDVSTIAYKGFDNHGYSVCCALLTRVKCKWVDESAMSNPKRKSLVPVKCPLYEGESNVPLSGSVTRPLHRLVAGGWEFKISFFHGDEITGKLKVPFIVRSEELY